MQTSNIDLIPTDNEQKSDRKAAFVLGALAATAVAGALGLGLLLGGREDAATNAAANEDGRTTIAGATGSPVIDDNSETSNDGAANSGGGVAGETSAPSGGGTDDGDDAPPAPTSTPEPPAPTNTPEPEPTATETAEPTVTPTVEPEPEPTIDPGIFELCVPCIDFDPELLLDWTAPAFDATWRMNCPSGTYVEFDVNETADLWVTYTIIGIPFESGHVDGTHFADTISGAIISAGDVVFHAEDAWGNASEASPGLSLCF